MSTLEHVDGVMKFHAIRHTLPCFHDDTITILSQGKVHYRSPIAMMGVIMAASSTVTITWLSMRVYCCGAECAQLML
jgi:hypothetical protein